MKKKLFFLLCALLTMFSASVQKVEAAAADYLTGWTEVTSLPTSSDIDNYYYVFVATEADLMVAEEVNSTQNTRLAPVYRKPTSPLTSKRFVWMLAYDAAHGYGIKNLGSNTYFLQTNTNSPWQIHAYYETSLSTDDWTKWTFAYDAGSWTIRNGKYPTWKAKDCYWGPWNSKAFNNGEPMAGNKAGDEIGKFKIYQMPRTTYDAKNVTSTYITNPSFEESVTGWTCSGATSGPNRENAHAASDGSWYAGFWNSNLSGDINLYQSVTLPAGFYRIEFDAYNDGSNTNKWKEVQLYFGDTKSSKLAYNTTYNSWRTFSFEFDVEDETTANLGAKFTPIATGRIWETADNFRLTFLGNTAVNAAKTHLSEEITNANIIYSSGANVGTGVFQIPVASESTFAGAISTAQAVYENGSATADEVSSAIDALKAAEEAYANATLNAPVEGIQYRLKNVSGATWANKYYRLYPNANQPNGGYSVSCDNDAKNYLAQSWKFTAASGTNCYTLSMTDTDGNTRYLCTNIKGYNSGSATQIRTTTEAEKALVVKVIATTGTDNVWNLQNTEDNSYIGGQDNGMYSNSQNYSMLIEAGEKATPNLTIAAGVNWATFISPFAVSLDELDEVSAYKITGVEGDAFTTEEVTTTIPANTPVLLYRKTTESNYSPDLTGWGTAAADRYDEGLLTGFYTRTAVAGNENHYLLQKNNGVVAFYNVAAGGLYIGAYRAYLTMPGEHNARPALYFPEDPTAINVIEAVETEANALKDGKYLIEGKIVIVKNGVKYDANGKKLN